MPFLPRRAVPIPRLALLVAFVLLAAPIGWRASTLIETPLRAGQSSATLAADRAIEGEAAARIQCATCHLVPPPDVLPRSVWRNEVARMFLIRQNQPEPAGPAGTAARLVSLPPDWQAIANYYESKAPEHLPAPDPWPAVDRPLQFRRSTMKPDEDAPPMPAVANVRLLDLDGDGRLEMIASDMRHGVVMTGRPYDPAAGLKVIAHIPNPAHIEPIDFDGDGIRDYLIGDLGRFLPADHKQGSVVWLRGRKDGTVAEMSLEGWPRVSDVEAGDFDGDGRLDLVVAAFGWRRTGDLTILKNDTTDYDRPSFAPYKLDARTGAIHAIPVDLNGDHKPDIVTLFAQEHETVVAFINTGAGMKFEAQTIYTAPHPNWGSSGIQLVDMDKDGDLDVLLAHGDTFDDTIIKPYHGIIWLENKGSYPFTAHEVARLAGVSRAQAADLDGDGDLDIVACAMLSSDDPGTETFPALVWLEQTRPGVFAKHTLERALPQHATLDLGDFDKDGDIDIVVGYFSFGPPQPTWIDVWQNLRK